MAVQDAIKEGGGDWYSGMLERPTIAQIQARKEGCTKLAPAKPAQISQIVEKVAAFKNRHW